MAEWITAVASVVLVGATVVVAFLTARQSQAQETIDKEKQERM